MSLLSYRCQYCPHTTAKKVNIYRHLIKTHSDYLPFNCERCGKPFPGRNELTAHNKFYHKSQSNGRKVFTLYSPGIHSSGSECDEEAQKELDVRLKPVIKATKLSRRFHCWKCNAGLPTRVGLNDHIMFVHYGMRNYRCEYCHERFETTLILKKHMKQVHDHPLFYPCQHCDVTFPHKTLLFQHNHRVHQNDPVARYFTDSSFDMLIDCISSLVMGGATDNFSVFVPVLTRCSEDISEKAASYSKAVKENNIASILSILGTGRKNRPSTDTVECPSWKLHAGEIVAKNVRSSPDLSTDESELDGEAYPSPSYNITPEATFPPTIVKQEPVDMETHAVRESNTLKSEPCSIKEEPVDVPVDTVVHLVNPGGDNSLVGTDPTVNGMLAVKGEPLPWKGNDVISNYNVDFTDNHVSDNSDSNEKVLPRRKGSARGSSIRSPPVYCHTDGARTRASARTNSRKLSQGSADVTDGCFSSNNESSLSGEEVSPPVRKRRRRSNSDSSYIPSDGEKNSADMHETADDDTEFDSDDGTIGGVKNQSKEESVAVRRLGVKSLRVNYGFAAVKKCKHCDEMHTVYTMRSHVADKHSSKRVTSKYNEEGFTCKHCPFKSKWRKSLNCHVLSKHSPDVEPFKCELCNYSSKIKKYVSKHVRMVHERQRFTCSQCPSTFSNISDMKDHVAMQHEGRLNHRCKLCSYACAYRSELYNHMKKYHRCIKCDFTHSDPGQLANHMAEQHSIVGNPNRSIKKWVCTETGCDYIGNTGTRCEHLETVHRITRRYKSQLLITKCVITEDDQPEASNKKRELEETKTAEMKKLVEIFHNYASPNDGPPTDNVSEKNQFNELVQICNTKPAQLLDEKLHSTSVYVPLNIGNDVEPKLYYSF